MSCLRSRREASGTTLIEVVVALGLMGGVLLCAAGLLVVGNRQIAGGARSSHAVALAESILEELELCAFDRLHEKLCCDAGLASCLAAPDSAAAAGWRGDAAEVLPGARVEVKLEAVGAGTLGAAAVLRLVVSIAWPEGSGERRLRLTALRV